MYLHKMSCLFIAVRTKAQLFQLISEPFVSLCVPVVDRTIYISKQ